MEDIEDRLTELGKHIREIDQNKLPPSTYCLEIFEKLPDYHESSLTDEERQKLESHLKECLWCFNSYMKYSFSIAQAEAGTLEPAPKWVKDIGMEVFNEFLLLKKLVLVHAICKFLRLKLYSPLRGARGEEEPGKGEYQIGESLRIELSAPEEGYLTVIHWDSKGKLQLILPDREDKETRLKKGEAKIIKDFKAGPPTGSAGLKAFFTKDKLIDPEEIDYQDERAINKVTNDFLEKIKALPKEDWSEETQEYVVVEKED